MVQWPMPASNKFNKSYYNYTIIISQFETIVVPEKWKRLQTWIVLYIMVEKEMQTKESKNLLLLPTGINRSGLRQFYKIPHFLLLQLISVMIMTRREREREREKHFSLSWWVGECEWKIETLKERQTFCVLYLCVETGFRIYLVRLHINFIVCRSKGK